jgi:hypothetical protein
MAPGGTTLGITNRGHFAAKIGAGDRTIVPAKIIADSRKILEDLRVRALIIVGGDGDARPNSCYVIRSQSRAIGERRALRINGEYQNYQVRHVPIAEAVSRLKLVLPNGELVQTARYVDISFGD